MGNVFRILMILLGILLFLMIIFSLAKRRMTYFFAFIWSAIALVMVLAGIYLRPTLLDTFMSHKGFIIVISAGLIILFTFWFLTIQVSILMRKNQELAIQVSLLNHDYVSIFDRLEELEDKDKK